MLVRINFPDYIVEHFKTTTMPYTESPTVVLRMFKMNGHIFDMHRPKNSKWFAYGEFKWNEKWFEIFDENIEFSKDLFKSHIVYNNSNRIYLIDDSPFIIKDDINSIVPFDTSLKVFIYPIGT